jgi:hypothetical protein
MGEVMVWWRGTARDSGVWMQWTASRVQSGDRRTAEAAAQDREISCCRPEVRSSPGSMGDRSRAGVRRCEVSGTTRGETDWLWVRWSRITLLRFMSAWNGVEVARWLEAAILRPGLQAAARRRERSPACGVVVRETLGQGVPGGADLMGELCLAPLGLRLRRELLSREEGMAAVLCRRAGVASLELGSLAAWAFFGSTTGRTAAPPKGWMGLTACSNLTALRGSSPREAPSTAYSTTSTCSLL